MTKEQNLIIKNKNITVSENHRFKRLLLEGLLLNIKAWLFVCSIYNIQSSNESSQNHAVPRYVYYSGTYREDGSNTDSGIDPLALPASTNTTAINTTAINTYMVQGSDHATHNNDARIDPLALPASTINADMRRADYNSDQSQAQTLSTFMTELVPLTDAWLLRNSGVQVVDNDTRFQATMRVISNLNSNIVPPRSDTYYAPTRSDTAPTRFDSLGIQRFIETFTSSPAHSNAHDLSFIPFSASQT